MFAIKPRDHRAGLLPRVDYPLRWMPEEVSALFNRLFAGWPPMEAPEWEPRWEMAFEDKEKEFLVRAEMPGFEPAEVKVELTGNTLTIEAEHKESAEKKEEKERAYAHV